MLYKDPEGERVFPDNEDAVQVTTMLGCVPPLDNEVDSLKKKIKHLEDVITEYKVCTVTM